MEEKTNICPSNPKIMTTKELLMEWLILRLLKNTNTTT